MSDNVNSNINNDKKFQRYKKNPEAANRGLLQ